jgi:hypothetical protein
MSNRVVSHRRLPALLAALLLLGLTSALPAAAKGPGTTTKYYAASATPTVVALPPAVGASVSVVLASCGSCEGGRTSTQPFGSAQVRFPATAPLVFASATVDRTGWSVQQVAGTAGETVLQLQNSGIGTTYAVPPGQAVTLQVPVAPDATPGRADLVTQVKQSNDFSGVGNDFVRVGADPTVYFGSGPATALEFVRQPTSVQGSTQADGSGTAAVLTTCASVRALDVFGNLATSFSGPVTLTPSDTGLGLALGGGTPVATDAVAGVAAFGTGTACTGGLSATKLGFGYTLTATSGTLTPDTSDPFDVLQFYAACGASCATPALGRRSGTTASATASSSSSDTQRFTFDVGQRGWEYADTCNPDVGALGTNPYRDAVTVDLDAHSKTVTLLWSKQAVQWAINNGASQWRVCVAATFGFAAVGGPATAVGGGFYVGALLPCGSSGLAATDPCLQKLNKSGGQQQAVVLLPLRDGDPRMI